MKKKSLCKSLIHRFVSLPSKFGSSLEMKWIRNYFNKFFIEGFECILRYRRVEFRFLTSVAFTFAQMLLGKACIHLLFTTSYGLNNKVDDFLALGGSLRGGLF